jgi:hypothetical protein
MTGQVVGRRGELEALDQFLDRSSFGFACAVVEAEGSSGLQFDALISGQDGAKG